ncbi:MAG: four-carbon acid sugar kinase family protein, partial [Planctomycetota bacterium]
MIVVIADDFTGDAELAGVGWRYALNTELQTLFDPASDAHLLVIDADSRSRSPQQAADRVRNMANQLT